MVEMGPRKKQRGAGQPPSQLRCEGARGTHARRGPSDVLTPLQSNLDFSWNVEPKFLWLHPLPHLPDDSNRVPQPSGPGPVSYKRDLPRVLDEKRQSACVREEPTSERKQCSGAFLSLNFSPEALNTMS